MKAPLPATAPHVSDIDSFVALIGAACQDEGLYATLEEILSLPDEKRKALLFALLRDLQAEGAPPDLMAAIESLVDDAVAERAYEVIFKCRRGDRNWNGASKRPDVAALVMTVLACLVLEALLAALCWPITHSLIGAVLASALIFGPASIFIGPLLYAQLRDRRERRA